MVDTINPNTDQPDSFPAPQQPAAAPTEGADHFYGGFDRPDEVKINLAGAPASSFQPTEQAPASAAPVAAAPQSPINDMKPVEPSFAPTETKLHTSYASSAPVNTRGLLVIAGIAIVATLIAGTGAFFITGAMGSATTKSLQTQINDLNKQLASLKEQPTALSVPETTTPEPTTTTPTTPANTQTTTTPETTPATTPAIETPSTTVSPANGDGRLGTG